jgi:hypothetical protein
VTRLAVVRADVRISLLRANVKMARQNQELRAELASARAEVETLSERLRARDVECDTLAAIVLAL